MKIKIYVYIFQEKIDCDKGLMPSGAVNIGEVIGWLSAVTCGLGP